jgi:DNA-binding MarR family transcriptional regulator
MTSVSSPYDGLPLPLLLVMRLANGFSREFAAALAAQEWVRTVDAGPPMYAVLRATGYLDGPSQRDIAATIMIDPSDLVAVLDRMENNGWVTRERDPADRRRSIVRITEQGRLFLERYNTVAHEVGERMMQGLDDAERATFTDLALRMLSSVDDPAPGWKQRSL